MSFRDVDNKKTPFGAYFSFKVVGREGFEPSTNGLKVRCSTD